jgi:hypothetical protein
LQRREGALREGRGREPVEVGVCPQNVQVVDKFLAKSYHKGAWERCMMMELVKFKDHVETVQL